MTTLLKNADSASFFHNSYVILWNGEY